MRTDPFSDILKLSNAETFVSGGFTYGLNDTLVHLEAAATGIVSGAHDGYTLADSAGTDFGALLTVADATLAVGAGNFVSGGYTYGLNDTLAHLEGAAPGEPASGS